MVSPIAILIVLSGFFYQEPTPGIYLVNPKSKRIKCENELVMLIGGQKVCLAPKPLLAKESVRGFSDIQYNPKFQVHYIEMDLTQDARKILTETVKSLPRSKFAFVLAGNVVFVFTIMENAQIKSLVIGQDVPLSDLTRIHSLLKAEDL